MWEWIEVKKYDTDGIIRTLYVIVSFSVNILKFHSHAVQIDVPQNAYSIKGVTLYGLRWVFSLSIIELMTHLFYYNAFALRWGLLYLMKLCKVYCSTLSCRSECFFPFFSGLWKHLSAVDIFIIGYGVRDSDWTYFVVNSVLADVLYSSELTLANLILRNWFNL